MNRRTASDAAVDRSGHAEAFFEGLVRVLRLESDGGDDGSADDDGELGGDERLVLRYLRARAARSASTGRSAPWDDGTNDAGDRPDTAAPTEATLKQDVSAPSPERPDIVASGASDRMPDDMADVAHELGEADVADDRADEGENTMARGPSGIPKIGLASETTAPAPTHVSLPNARTHHDYEARIEGFTDLALVDDGGSGLRVDARGAVTGTALKAGEYALALTGHRTNAAVPITVHARVSVIADPRDLWRDRPSDRDAPHWKPDCAAEARSSRDALLIAASRRGRAHAHEGGCRDDDVALHVAPERGGWHVLAVADGAGSAPLSRAGSAAACEAARSALARSLGEDAGDLAAPLLDAAHAAADAVETLAAADTRPVGDYATTLLLAVARCREGRWEIAAFAVGDGAIVLYDATGNEGAGEAVPLCRPDEGEFAGQTRFLDGAALDAPDVARRVFTVMRPRFTALIAMTDGVTDPKFPTTPSLADPEAWREVWADLGPALDPDRPRAEGRLLDWLDFWSRGNHDDRTLAALLPAGERG